MARFTIYSPAGVALYEGTPSFTGQYMKPGLLEFREVALPALVDLVPGCYVDYARTGHRYRIYTAPQLKKQARTNTYGGAFVYQSVQLYDASKMLEYCPFRDLVLGDNRIHFSTQPSISTFEGCDGLARRFEACLRDQYDVNGVQSWAVRIADAYENPDLHDLMLEPRDFTVSGVNILECLDKIYEIWPGVGWLYTVENSVDTIVIGGVGTNSGTYAYGKGNGLTSLTRTAANAEEIANRIFAYGSSRNMLPRWYNSQNIKDAESVDIQNLMIPVSSWGLTDNLPDAAKAFVEDATSILKNGLRPATVYFDGKGEYPEIYPSLRETTIGMVRTAIGDSTAKYYPSTAVYTNPNERIDEVLAAPATYDSGKAGADGKDAVKTDSESVTDTESGSVTAQIPAFQKLYLNPFYTKTVVVDGAGDYTIKLNVPATGTASLTGALGYLGIVIRAYRINSNSTETLIGEQETKMSQSTSDATAWTFKAAYLSVPQDSFSAGQSVRFEARVVMAKTVQNGGGTYTISLSGNASYSIAFYRAKTFTISIRQVGFDINEQAALGGGKTIAMRTGKCAGRSFAINDVQYDDATDSWKLECWRTEDESLSQWFPNTDYPVRGLENAGQSNEYPGDEFVLLDIAMPSIYVQMAEQKLLTAAQELLADTAVERWQYSPEIDAKFMVENNRTINAGEYLILSDADIIGQTAESVLVDTVTINEGESAIPTYKVTLRDRKKKTWTESQSPEQSSGKPVGSIQTQQETPYVDLSGYVKTDEFNDLADRVTALEGESLFMLDSSGNVTLKASYNNLWVPGWLAAGGIGSGGGGGGGVDLDRVWQSLTNNTDKPNVKINIAHIPDITTAKITDLESWISAKGYALTSSLPTEQTVAGWGFTKNAGTVTSVTLNSGDGIAVTNSGVAITTSGSRTISISSTYRTRINNGNTAYGWGNHAEAGYLTSADLSGYATESWANNRFLLKAGGDISGDIFHEVAAAEEGSDEIVIDELWRITDNGYATFRSLSVDGVDFSTVNSRVNTLWNARNNYVTLSGAQTITGEKTFSAPITMSGANILSSADSTNNIGSSSARFSTGYIRNIYTTFFAFMSDDGQTLRGTFGMGEDYASINFAGTPTVSYHFYRGAGFFHNGDGDVPCGRSDHRWEKVWSVDADLSGNLVIGGDIIPSADLGSQLGYSNRRFSNLNVRTLGSVKEINFKDSNNSATTGYLSFANGWMILRSGADINSSYKQITFHETYGLYPENGHSINLGYYSSTDNRYRWANIYGVNANLSGNIDVAGVVRVNSLNTIDQSNASMSLFNFGARATKTFNAYGTGVNFRACDSNGDQVNILAINATKIQAGSDLIPNYTEGLNLGGSSANTRWATIYGVDANLSGDLALAQTGHIDIGPVRIEYDAQNDAIHITTNDSTNHPTIGIYADGFVAAGGVGQTS